MPLLEQVLEQYPDKVKLVFKNFPLGNHPQAQPAAIAALAAWEQGKFWEFHDRIFAIYNRLSSEALREIAVDLGLDMERFEKDIASPRLRNQVLRDLQNGRTAGVRGTPTVYVNGVRLQTRSLAGFKELIERELKREDP